MQGQKMLSQFERLQMKMTQQKELIEQLKKENSTLTELKVHIEHIYVYVHAHVHVFLRLITLHSPVTQNNLRKKSSHCRIQGYTSHSSWLMLDRSYTMQSVWTLREQRNVKTH